MKVTIMQGLPGWGKTTLIPMNDGKTRIVVSADHFFLDAKGEYKFDASKLAEAHNACLREYGVVVTSSRWSPLTGLPDELVVDNTNTTVEEVARYYSLAQAFGHEVRIVALSGTPEEGAARNVHGVSLDTCKRLFDNLVTFNYSMPKWWTRIWTAESQFDWATSGWAVPAPADAPEVTP